MPARVQLFVLLSVVTTGSAYVDQAALLRSVSAPRKSASPLMVSTTLPPSRDRAPKAHLPPPPRPPPAAAAPTTNWKLALVHAFGVFLAAFPPVVFLLFVYSLAGQSATVASGLLSLGLPPTALPTSLPLLAHGWVLAYLACEACHFLYSLLRTRLPSRMAAPERSYAERLGQFRRCLADSTVSTKEWITRWFYYEKKGSTEHVAPSLDELKRGNVREWLSWSLFSKSIEGLTPALEAELSQALEMLEARLHNEENGLLGALSPQGRFAFADGFDTQLRSMRLTVDKPAIHHKVGRRTRPPPPRRPVALCPRAPGRPPPLLSPALSSHHTASHPSPQRRAPSSTTRSPTPSSAGW